MRMHIYEGTVRGKKLGGKQWPTNSPKLVRLLTDGMVPVNALLERVKPTVELKQTIRISQNELLET